MTKTIKIALLVLAGLASPSLYAQKIIKLNPKESKQFTNHFVWTVNATCNIQSDTPSNKIKFRVLNNNGKVNGKKLTKGQATSVNVNNNGSISVSADPGTEVNLMNMGSGMVSAVCSA